MNYGILQDVFTEKFATAPALVVRAPGRINLIGEHTDYNDGLVLPAAIDKYMYCAIGTASESLCTIYSIDFKEVIKIDLNEKLKPLAAGHWGNYIIGVIAGLLQDGHPVKGFKAVFTSTIPPGAGLASSAALEVVFGFAIARLQGLGPNLPLTDIARIGQYAEHQFAGVACGLMDQFAACLGRKGQVFELDCRSLTYQYVKAELGEYRLVLYDSHVKHELAGSAYNQRRLECEAGVKALQRHYPKVQALRDAAMDMLPAIANDVGPAVYNRCRFVIAENQRVTAATRALARGDLATLGQLMYASHHGLAGLYAVSCAELDYLIDLVKERAEVLGARMMGGGFGGCTLNLVRKDKAAALTSWLSEKYYARTGRKLQAYFISLSDGVAVI